LRWGKFKNGISLTLRKAATIEVLPVTPSAAMRAMLNPSLRNRIQATIWSILSLTCQICAASGTHSWT
jgi:hypothetical protein